MTVGTGTTLEFPLVQSVGPDHPIHKLLSRDGKSLREFQKESYFFWKRANWRALITHEMTLGKTVITLAGLAMNPELWPVIIVVKSKVRYQWLSELLRWASYNQRGIIPCVVRTSKGVVNLDIANVVIISYDVLKLHPDIHTLPFKTVIFDEIQQIKNIKAWRTSAAIRLAEGRPYILGLSGTPIRNHAGEYYPALHLVRPDLFPSEDEYYEYWCDWETDTYSTTYTGIKERRIQEFQDYTKDFILRYEKADVWPELPPVNRMYRHIELEGRALAAYKAELNKLQNIYDGTPDTFAEAEGHLMRMRHILGAAKVPGIMEFVEEFLESCPRKLAIFVHHHDVGDLLQSQITMYALKRGFKPPIMIRSGDANAEHKLQLWREDPKFRVGILSTQSAGEGSNLQFCADAILAERQLNPTYEEQVEMRFPREGQTENVVNIHYMIAAHPQHETPDQILTFMNEDKRSAIGTTQGKNRMPVKEAPLVKELLAALARQRRS